MPLQQFRLWLRRASGVERGLTGVAFAVSVALLFWLLAPVGSDGSASGGFTASDSLVGTQAPTGGAGGSATGRSGTPAPRRSTAATTGARTTGPLTAGNRPAGTITTGAQVTSGAGSSGRTGNGATGGSSTARQCPTGSGQGVTSSKVDLAITLIDLVGPAGNSAVGVPSADEQKKDWQQVADSINGAGGGGCRKLVLHFYTVNPLDSSGAQQVCLTIAADKPFMALDSGALTIGGQGDCLPQQKIALITQYATADEVKKYYPYYLSPKGLQTEYYLTGFLGAKQKGYFSAASGFKKLGIISQSCRPSVVDAGRAAIRRAGVPDSAVVSYSFGCPPGSQVSPADAQQAVLAFQRAGVTHVTQLDAQGWNSFTKAAAQQNYKPQYLFADDGAAADFSGAFGPDASNFDGALNVIGMRYGEQSTAGYQPSAGTARCNAIYAKHGQKPVYQQGSGYGGVVCNYLWIVQSMLDHVTVVQGSALANSMHGIGLFDSSFPFGTVDFSAEPAGAPYGKQYWRVQKFSGACACWKVLDPTFHAPLS